MKVNGQQINISETIKDLPAGLQEALLQHFDSNSAPGYFSPAEVQQLMTNYNFTLQQLMNALVPLATSFARPTISAYPVGAVVHGVSGALYFGANLEFVSEALSFTVHAEQASIAHAISYGELGVDYLAISEPPCGYCRQFLYEISNCPTTPDINVLVQNNTYLLSNLLPLPFGPGNLGKNYRLMQPQQNNLQMSTAPTDPVIITALAAANSSYAPYTSDFSGVCIQTTYGDIYTGSYAENAAYNPSMSPLEAALVLLSMSGDSYQYIARVVLVEAAASKCSQLEATIDVLAAIAPSIVAEYYTAQ